MFSLKLKESQRLLLWQTIVIFTTFMAYLLHYFCKNHLFVVLTDYRHYLNPYNSNDAQKWLGIMMAFGYAAYICGKITFALLTDAVLKSAVQPLLVTLIFTPIFTTIFTIKITDYTLRIFISIILWFILRFFLASGFVGLTKITVNWISYKHLGRVMGVLNVSWLLGDAISRAALGLIYDAASGNSSTDQWRIVFWSAAVITASAILPTYILIKDLPSQRGLPLIEDSPENAHSKSDLKKQQNILKQQLSYNAQVDNDNNYKIRALSIEAKTNNFTFEQKYTKYSCDKIWNTMRPLLSEFLFWIVLVMNFQCIFMRELFSIYFIAYLEDEIDMKKSNAALISALFSVCGVFGNFFCGIWFDKIKTTHWKLSIIPLFAMVDAFCLSVFAFFDPNDLSVLIVIILVMTFGFSALGPYSLITGAVVQHIGGQTATGMVSGFVSAAGYLAGIVVTLFSSYYDYRFLYTMAVFAAITLGICGCIVFIYYRIIHYRTSKYDKLDESVTLI
eukprot:199450_1